MAQDRADISMQSRIPVGGRSFGFEGDSGSFPGRIFAPLTARKTAVVTERISGRQGRG